MNQGILISIKETLILKYIFLYYVSCKHESVLYEIN